MKNIYDTSQQQLIRNHDIRKIMLPSEKNYGNIIFNPVITQYEPIGILHEYLLEYVTENYNWLLDLEHERHEENKEVSENNE